MGDLGALAAKNVRRNPARIAAIAFIITFIIAYGVQVNGQMASQQDYLVRQVQYSVGGDISIGVSNATETHAILNDILGNVTGVKNSTIEYTLQQNQANTVVKTIDPDSFLATAYYESDWFSGASMQQMFSEMKADGSTIILEQRVAQQYNLKVGDKIAIDFQSGPRTLKIIGLFGPKVPSNQMSPVVSSYGSSPNGGQIYYGGQMYWSYISTKLFNMTVGSDAYTARKL